MKEKYVKVYIEWLNKGISKSEVPPEGIRFCPQIRFDDEKNKDPNWTAEIIIRRWGDNSSCFAELRYLFDKAPHHLLKQGKTFIIFDGPNKIANGKVVSDLY